MSKIGAIIAKEIREALPATIFFLLLFHLIALTKAVLLDDYSITSLRAAVATIGALIVAKGILVVEALPFSRLFSGRPTVQILWKTVLYSIVVLLFKVVEETIPLVSEHGGVVSAARVMYHEVSWPLLAVLALWIIGGLLLYCLFFELVSAVGPDRAKEIFFGKRGKNSDR